MFGRKKTPSTPHSPQPLKQHKSSPSLLPRDKYLIVIMGTALRSAYTIHPAFIVASIHNQVAEIFYDTYDKPASNAKLAALGKFKAIIFESSWIPSISGGDNFKAFHDLLTPDGCIITIGKTVNSHMSASDGTLKYLWLIKMNNRQVTIFSRNESLLILDERIKDYLFKLNDQLKYDDPKKITITEIQRERWNKLCLLRDASAKIKNKQFYHFDELICNANTSNIFIEKPNEAAITISEIMHLKMIYRPTSFLQSMSRLKIKTPDIDKFLLSLPDHQPEHVLTLREITELLNIVMASEVKITEVHIKIRQRILNYYLSNEEIFRELMQQLATEHKCSQDNMTAEMLLQGSVLGNSVCVPIDDEEEVHNATRASAYQPS